MRNRILISVVILAALTAVVSCSKGGPRIIPRSKMIRIYEEMFITDQWIETHRKFRGQADTMFLYEPIFRKYGYSTEDYFASVDHYMEKPSSYAKMVHEVVTNLNDRHDRLTEEMTRKKEEEDKLMTMGMSFEQRGLRITDYGRKLRGRYRADTLLFTVDTMGRYILNPIQNRSWKNMYNE